MAAKDQSKPAPTDDIAIIGIGCMFPQAKDLEGYWANIREGVDGITATPNIHRPPLC